MKGESLQTGTVWAARKSADRFQNYRRLCSCSVCKTLQVLDDVVSGATCREQSHLQDAWMAASGPSARTNVACLRWAEGLILLSDNPRLEAGAQLRRLRASCALTPPAWWRLRSSWRACTATTRGLIAWRLGESQIGGLDAPGILLWRRVLQSYMQVAALEQAPPGRYALPWGLAHMYLG